ncbi:MAG TPA: hypothetical protein VLY21_04260 [Nitrososphaerales archaeon]|nr:hypothetical protein [Nitrososphaerales archaeon]
MSRVGMSGGYKVKLLSVAALAVLLCGLAIPGVQASSTPTATRVRLVITTYKDAGLTRMTHRVRAGETLYVVVGLQDQSGRPFVWNGSSALQIALSASAGSLSATSVYITPGTSNTTAGFGLIVYFAPPSAGTQHMAASATLLGKSQTAGERIKVV